MATVLLRPSPAAPQVAVGVGPRLLAGIEEGPGLAAHRRRWAAPPATEAAALVRLAELIGLRGRGGAGFPFARKLATASRRGAVVVVNVSEGEPASFKDAALALTRPHLILDGAELIAGALGSDEVHLVLPEEHTAVRDAVATAIAERAASGLSWRVHVATPRFVAGQARAVLELMAGRPNLPVTAWQPEAFRGHRGRPTLLSNAETFSQLAAARALGADGFAELGTGEEPGTTLLTFNGDSGRPIVREVALGTPWGRVVNDEALAAPVLVGGYHGAWLAAGALRGAVISRADVQRVGASLGAGVVLPLAPGSCPLRRTAEIVGYLAAESAGRCGPCVNGLPALAAALAALAQGAAGPQRVEELVALVTGRGACAHPDGTARLAASVLRTFPGELAAHRRGRCDAREPGWEMSA